MAENAIENEIARVVANGALGRSTVYARILRYLADASKRGALPKEIDIASDVLDKQQFEPGTDSTVRVYVHNLRQKLDAFYAADTSDRKDRLTIPKGKYKLVLAPSSARIEQVQAKNPWPVWLKVAGMAAFTIVVFGLGRFTDGTRDADPANDYATAPVWQAIADNDKPVSVIVGDYFMFAEGSREFPGDRLIRDFSINSTDEFEQWIAENPTLAEQYTDIRLSYLPLGVATALNDVLRVLHKKDRRIRMIPQSQFHPRMLRTSHIVYVGYVSGLGDLDQYLFSASKLALGSSYDELIDIGSGEHYVSSAGYVTDDDSHYTDYGFVSTFPGPSNNQFVFVTGLRDEGLMRMAAILADPAAVSELGSKLQSPSSSRSFEALYRVSGIDRTHVAAAELFTSPVDASEIWLQ